MGKTLIYYYYGFYYPLTNATVLRLYIRNNIIFLYNIFRTYSVPTNKTAELEIVDIFEVLLHAVDWFDGFETVDQNLILKRWVRCSNMLRYLCLSYIYCYFSEETSWSLDFSSPRTITTCISTGMAPETLRDEGCAW